MPVAALLTPLPRLPLQAAPAQQPQPGVPSKAVQDKVAALLQEAQDLQYDEKLAEAAALLRQGGRLRSGGGRPPLPCTEQHFATADMCGPASSVSA